jgi:GNAT superfamily N-acetyltransferase
MDIAQKISLAFAWHRALGHETAEDPLCRIVWDRAHPDVWDANHVSLVRAATRAEIEDVLGRADTALAHCRHRAFMVDPLTPPAFEARLALEDYSERTPTLQLVLEGRLKADPRDVDLRPVTTDEDWRSLEALVQQDHLERMRIEGLNWSSEVTRGIVAGFRLKWPVCQFFLAREEGMDAAYGAGILCEGGLGMVEDLFTLPAFRHRGLATAIIARAIEHARGQGAGPIFIGARVMEAPKRLYAALGFEPVCLTRGYIKHLAN